jgi:sugar lactone lactonase YvrE
LLILLVLACNKPCEDGLCIVAGTGMPGNDEAITQANESPLYGPMDVVVWKDAGDFFIGDWNNHKIRHVSDGLVETIIGTEFLGDGDPDFDERTAPGVPGTEVALNHPTQMEWNNITEKLLVPSWHNHRVREWSPDTGKSYVVCANTAIDDGNGANAGFAGDGGPAAEALMAFPNSIAVDPDDGSFWLLAQKNVRIRKVAADYSLIDTIAGSGDVGYGGDGADALEASFDFWNADDLQPEPAGAVEYHNGKLYIADSSNHVIRVMDLETGVIDSLPNLGEQSLSGGDCDRDALCFPRDIEIGPAGLLWIADEGNHVIRTYDIDTQTLETVVGNFTSGASEDGAEPLEASLNRPHGIDLASDGTLLIADTYNHRILRLIP